MSGKLTQTIHGVELELENTWDLYLEDGTLNRNYMKGRYVYNAESGKYGVVKATYLASESEDKKKAPKYHGTTSEGNVFYWKVSTTKIFPQGWVPVKK